MYMMGGVGAHNAGDELNVLAYAPSPLLPQSSVQKVEAYFQELTVKCVKVEFMLVVHSSHLYSGAMTTFLKSGRQFKSHWIHTMVLILGESLPSNSNYDVIFDHTHILFLSEEKNVKDCKTQRISR